MDLRKIDVAIAEKKGWTWYPVPFNDEQKVLAPSEEDAKRALLGLDIWQRVPYYSTDGNWMIGLMEDIVQVFGPSKEFRLTKGATGWMASGIERYGETSWSRKPYAHASTPQLAVALLWCDVHGVEVPL
jgi:hypothetical protein